MIVPLSYSHVMNHGTEANTILMKVQIAWAIIIIMAMGAIIYACAPLIDGLGLETQTA